MHVERGCLGSGGGLIEPLKGQIGTLLKDLSEGVKIHLYSLSLESSVPSPPRIRGHAFMKLSSSVHFATSVRSYETISFSLEVQL
jgi:hypothetical protein